MQTVIDEFNFDTSCNYVMIKGYDFLNKIIFDLEDISRIKSFTVYNVYDGERYKICETLLTDKLEYPLLSNGASIYCCLCYFFNFEITFNTEIKNLNFKLICEDNYDKVKCLNVQMSNDRYVKTIIENKKIIYSSGFVHVFDLDDDFIENKLGNFDYDYETKKKLLKVHGLLQQLNKILQIKYI